MASFEFAHMLADNGKPNLMMDSLMVVCEILTTIIEFLANNELHWDLSFLSSTLALRHRTERTIRDVGFERAAQEIEKPTAKQRESAMQAEEKFCFFTGCFNKHLRRKQNSDCVYV